VTQQFNTATSMGRLLFNVLLSFAQFEREIISERTRDKMAATRRKGKWSGDLPVLGYDIDPQGYHLILNEDEAVRMRAIVALYLEHEALLPVVQPVEVDGETGRGSRDAVVGDDGGGEGGALLGAMAMREAPVCDGGALRVSEASAKLG